MITAITVKEARATPDAAAEGRCGSSSATSLAYRRMWLMLVTGLLEPLLYLLSIGIGVGGLVGQGARARAVSRSRTTSSWRPG